MLLLALSATFDSHPDKEGRTASKRAYIFEPALPGSRQAKEREALLVRVQSTQVRHVLTHAHVTHVRDAIQIEDAEMFQLQ